MKYLCFTAIVTTLIPQFPPSSYQNKLHKKILELQKSGLGYRRIAYWLNDNGYKTPRGHLFESGHVYSIARKRKRRLEIIDRKPTLSISDINFRYKKNG